MTKKTTALLALTFLAAASFSNNAFAQSTRTFIQGPSQQPGNTQRVMVDPGFQQPTPKLGFQGQMLFGNGMKVVSVNWGSAAQRAGLEPGDIITKINGRQIQSQWDYDQALLNAANYNYGQVQMKVRNVRYNWGYNVPMFAHVHTVLDGYGGQVGPQSQGQSQVQSQSHSQNQGGPVVAARRK